MAGEGAEGLATLATEAAMAEFVAAVRAYAAGLTENFASLTSAQPEDQLKAPVMELVAAAGKVAGLDVLSRTEVRVAGVGGRPDLGVDVNKALTGNIELKAPGKGAQPERFKDKRSRDQFIVFSDLPNLLYTDGQEWALYTYGELTGEVLKLTGDPTTDGADGVTEPDAAALLDLLGRFLSWQPVVPSSSRSLAALLAPVTRRLRDEVIADVKDTGPMAALYAEWRDTLFPDADVATFSDGYAQTFTYALLLARLEGAPSPLTAATAAQELEADHALLAQVLLILGQPAARKAIEMPVALLERLIGAVDVNRLSKKGNPWLYFYEHFLAEYDPEQRNNRGVYYTPKQVVAAQVRISHQVLVDSFEKEAGFGDPDVVSLDPAVGTGTYPLTIIDHTLDETVERLGEGMKGEVASRLARNLNAFELLVGPYAMTHLQVSRKLVDAGADMPDDGVRVFLTDSLASPAHEGFAHQASLFQQRLALEQERASKLKSADIKVTVVIGNPPWDRDESQTDAGTRRKGGMVRYEADTDRPGLLRDFIDPLTAAGLGVHAKTLYNDYVYFWRWAIWKACEQTSGPAIVSFITASSYLTGPGFSGMREVMRRRFDELWLLDLGGEGRGARKEENVFPGVLSPVVIAVAVRKPEVDGAHSEDSPAKVRYRRIVGSRDEKLAALDALTTLDPDDEWDLASDDWGATFIPRGAGAFADWPLVEDLMPWRETGTHFYRTWPIGESVEVLRDRWAHLLKNPNQRSALLKESRDRKATKAYRDILTGEPLPAIADLPSDAGLPRVHRFGFRSFDRRHCLLDGRVGDYLRPQLWAVASQEQMFLQTLVQSPLSSGPAMVAFADVPDCHGFRGSYGDKGVFPAWRDRDAKLPNLTDGLLELLSEKYGRTVTANDLTAYLFGLLGTAAYTARFGDELATSSPRIPFTADGELFGEVVDLGRELLWWATYGERFQPVDAKGRAVRRLPAGTAKNLKAVPSGAANYPDKFSYDEATKTVRVGDGEFGPVEPEVWAFGISGFKVVQSWLAYRMKKGAGKKSSALDDIRPTSWSFSSEFVELLWVLEHFVDATERAALLLDRVVGSELIPSDAFPEPDEDQRKAPAVPRPTTGQQGMFDTPGEAPAS